jgi:hypothetical protein
MECGVLFEVRAEYYSDELRLPGVKLHCNKTFHPSNGATAQIGPWSPLLRIPNNNVLRCEVVSLATNPH